MNCTYYLISTVQSFILVTVLTDITLPTGLRLAPSIICCFPISNLWRRHFRLGETGKESAKKRGPCCLGMSFLETRTLKE